LPILIYYFRDVVRIVRSAGRRQSLAEG
jgi:hypothetical protein